MQIITGGIEVIYNAQKFIFIHSNIFKWLLDCKYKHIQQKRLFKRHQGVFLFSINLDLFLQCTVNKQEIDQETLSGQ